MRSTRYIMPSGRQEARGDGYQRSWQTRRADAGEETDTRATHRSSTEGGAKKVGDRSSQGAEVMTTTLRHRCEIEYAARLDALGIRWRVPRMRTFALARTTYTPDFYLPDQDIYVEVIGTRQRWSQLRHKIRDFRRWYPTVSLLVVDRAGRPIEDDITDEALRIQDRRAEEIATHLRYLEACGYTQGGHRCDPRKPTVVRCGSTCR